MQECDIYLLDDVLAAVDASVAALLWKRAICGLLRSKTRLVRPILMPMSFQMITSCSGRSHIAAQSYIILSPPYGMLTGSATERLHRLLNKPFQV